MAQDTESTRFMDARTFQIGSMVTADVCPVYYSKARHGPRHGQESLEGPSAHTHACGGSGSLSPSRATAGVAAPVLRRVDGPEGGRRRHW
jgi:hypothetical protein